MTTQYPEIHLTKVLSGQSPEQKTDQFFVTKSFVYYHPLVGKRIVSGGFITDGLSVPQLFWGLIPPHGVGFPAAVVHDDCYINNLGADRYGDIDARLAADLLFRDNCRELGMPEWQVNLTYLAVRLGGKSNWNKFKNQRQYV